MSRKRVRRPLVLTSLGLASIALVAGSSPAAGLRLGSLAPPTGGILSPPPATTTTTAPPAGAATASAPSRTNPTPMATATPMAASPLSASVTDLDHGESAASLAGSLVGGGITITDPIYTGATRSGGRFSAGEPTIGFDSGVVLASGAVQTVESDSLCSKGIEGPNGCESNTLVAGTPGDPDLDSLAGFPTNDAAILEFDFVPDFSSISFRYVFGSEEYREYANSQFNDTFAFFVNGTNCATVPGTGEPVSVNTINNGNPGGDTTPHNEELYRDNPASAPTIDIEYDGLTTILTCQATVLPGEVNHVRLAIADGSDSALDSAVFIEAGSFVSTPPCTEDGLAVVGGGVASGTVHDSVEPAVAGLGLDQTVHDVNCAAVVPVEDVVDSLFG